MRNHNTSSKKMLLQVNLLIAGAVQSVNWMMRVEMWAD